MSTVMNQWVSTDITCHTCNIANVNRHKSVSIYRRHTCNIANVNHHESMSSYRRHMSHVTRVTLLMSTVMNQWVSTDVTRVTLLMSSDMNQWVSTRSIDVKMPRNRYWKLLLSLYSAKVIIVPYQIAWSCYTGCWCVGCYIWYSKEGTGQGSSPPRPLHAVPNVTAHPSTTIQCNSPPINNTLAVEPTYQSPYC